ncbi:MAG: MFS transporter [Rhabdochlamydiaceae bacterium]|nr:MFS transporter [Candidatus Amphrikana amoebophyrae]
MNTFALTRKRSNIKVLALLASTSALSMILLDSATFPLALPTIQSVLNLTSFQVQWLLNAYFLTTAALVIVGGKVADIIGYRKAFVFGLAMFALSNVAVGVSTSYLPMIICRIIQGMGAALIGPIGFAILIETFAPKERGRAIGISAGIGSVFLTLGPLVAGFLVEFVDWRKLFFLFLPIATVGIILTYISVKEPKRKNEQIDFISLIMIILGIFFIVFSLMQSRVWGLNSAHFYTGLAIGLFFILLLILRNKGRENAFIDFSIFRNRHFRIGVLVSLLTWMVMVNPIFWSIFLQKGLFYSPVETATYLIISTLPVLFTAPASGLMADKKGAQLPIYLGLFFVLISVFLMMLFSLFHTIFFLICALFTFGIGTSLIFTPVGNIALAKIPAAQRGLASGIYNTMRFLGSAFGVVILGYISFHSREETFSRLIAQSPQIQDITFKQAHKIVHYLPDTIDPLLLSSYKNLVTTSSFAAFSAVNICTGFIVIIALLLTLVYLKDYREGN